MASIIERSTTVAEYGSSAFQDRTSPKTKASSRFFVRVVAMVLILLSLGVVLGLRWGNFNYYWYSPLANTYSIAIAGFIFSRFLISLIYSPPKDINFSPIRWFFIEILKKCVLEV